MSLEEFLKPDGYYFHFIHASDLMNDVCYIITILDRDRYYELYTFLENKEKYIALKAELDALIIKYKLHDRLGVQCSEGEEEYSEEDDDYDVLRYKKLLVHADKLLARDPTWSKTYRDSM